MKIEFKKQKYSTTEYKEINKYDMFLMNCPQGIYSLLFNMIKSECEKKHVLQIEFSQIPGLSKLISKENSSFRLDLENLQSKQHSYKVLFNLKKQNYFLFLGDTRTYIDFDVIKPKLKTAPQVPPRAAHNPLRSKIDYLIEENLANMRLQEHTGQYQLKDSIQVGCSYLKLYVGDIVRLPV